MRTVIVILFLITDCLMQILITFIWLPSVPNSNQMHINLWVIVAKRHFIYNEMNEFQNKKFISCNAIIRMHMNVIAMIFIKKLIKCYHIEVKQFGCWLRAPKARLARGLRDRAIKCTVEYNMLCITRKKLYKKFLSVK
jgi:hypothetical protein